MHPIEFGWIVPIWSVPRDHNQASHQAFLATIEQILEKIAGHFTSAWFIDHLQFSDLTVLEGWTALTYYAARHPELVFGHCVLSQSFRNPALLAKMAATLQYMSNGRFILGLGAGWKEDEYHAYGYPFPPLGQRIEELEETLQLIQALWQEENVTFAGKHYHVSGATCLPRPSVRPPIMIGAGKPRMLRLVARYADCWNALEPDLDAYRAQAQECAKACAEVGRDPQTLRRSWYGSCRCVATEREAATLPPRTAKTGFQGTPAQVIEQMQAYIDLGLDSFLLQFGNFPDAPDLTTLDLLINEIIPVLKKN